jgi:hypothetical protein
MTRRELELDLGRRSFLKLGLAGGAALGLAGIGATLSGCGARDAVAARGYRFLRDADLQLLGAVMPVILAGAAVDLQTRDAVLRSLDELLIRAGGPAQGEIRRLFDLLNLGVTRRLLAGVRKPWHEADHDEVERFLQRWRSSSFGLFNSGYRALVKLCSVPYFGSPIGYRSAGYPGPLDWMYKAVNA